MREVGVQGEVECVGACRGGYRLRQREKASLKALNTLPGRHIIIWGRGTVHYPKSSFELILEPKLKRTKRRFTYRVQVVDTRCDEMSSVLVHIALVVRCKLFGF